MRGDQQSPRYHHQEGWGKIQSFFPESFQLNHANLPKEEWYGWKESRIHVDRYEVKQSSAKLIIFHGGGGYGRLMAPYGIMAQQSGYEAVVPDLPGYGLTQVPKKDAFLYQDWVDFAIDFIRAEQQRDSRPIVLFGGSMGGLLAYEAAARSRIPAGIAATCLLDPQDPQVRRAVSLYSWMGSLIGPLFKVGRPLLDPMRIPMRWIAKMNAIVNDPEIAKIIAKDPLGGGTWMPGRWIRSWWEHQTIPPEQFDVCPVLLLHPADDRWTPVAVSQPFFQRLPVAKQTVLLGNAGHFPLEEPGISQLRTELVQFLRKCS